MNIWNSLKHTYEAKGLTGLLVPDSFGERSGAVILTSGGLTAVFQLLADWSVAIGALGILGGLAIQIYSAIVKNKREGREEKRNDAAWRMRMKKDYGLSDTQLDDLL